MNFYSFTIFLSLLSLVIFAYKVESDSKEISRPTSNGKYVIIDTDAGVDDALALMLALDAHQRGLINILAITCTYGNGILDNVIKNVLLTMNITGVEVYKGAETPLLQKKFEQDDYFGEDALGNATHYYPNIEVKIESEHAVLALIRLVKQYPKQITLITIGPMTNLAMAIQLEPSLTKNLIQIVSMGGLFNGLGNILPNTEFNFNLDPESVSMVLNKSECPLLLSTWDISLNYKMPLAKFNEIKALGTKRAHFIGNIFEMMIKTEPENGLVLADILCIIADLFPNLVKESKEYSVAMELSGRFSRGQLVVSRSSFGNYFESSRNVSFVEKIDLQKSIELISEMALRE